MKFITTCCVACAMSLAVAGKMVGEDWAQFRGPGGLGISSDLKVPVTWSDSENIKWKVSLPGPGSSSPIVVGDRVFITCYSGYGVSSRNPGSLEDLERHLVCIHRTSGKVLWSKAVPATRREDPFEGYITEHGYSSSTPASDGERVYVFFGKTGVLAFDLEGEELWRTGVGTESSNRKWGSASSPVLYKDMVIVNASEESQSIRALNKLTGKEIWKAEGAGLELAYGTPTLVELDDGHVELVICLPREVWGLNPDTGKLGWYAEINMDGNICPSVLARDGIVYAFGGFQTFGSVAIRAGGKGDVTSSHVLWTSRNSSYVPSPLIHEEHLYWVNEMGIAHCAEAKTGTLVYEERLTGIRGGRSSGGKSFYASLVLVNGKLYSVSRTEGCYVLAARPKFEQIAQNKIESDSSLFNSSPAISDGRMYLRSNEFLYCLGAE